MTIAPVAGDQTTLLSFNAPPDNKTSMPVNTFLWRDLTIALRQVDQLYSRQLEPLGLTVVEWHILQALYEQDGQHASVLARKVGRAGTAFTPVLDKLQAKDLIWREPDQQDRRAVHIFLTPKALAWRSQIQETARQLDDQLLALIGHSDYAAFQRILTQLQDVGEF